MSKKDLVFVHIHRTGGSSIWHSMAPLAVPAGWAVCDIYDQCKRAYGKPIRSNDIIWAARQCSRNAAHLFHHHSPESIRESFHPDRTLFATVVRDPIERMVSLVQVMRDLLTLPVATPEIVEYYREMCGEEFCQLASQHDPSLESLLEAASCQPHFNGYYATLFTALCQDSVGEGRVNQKKTDQDIRLLAQDVHKTFAVVGWFGKLEQAYCDIVRTFGLGDRDSEMRIAVNRTGLRVLLSPWHKKRYFRRLETEYALLEHLGVRGSAFVSKAA